MALLKLEHVRKEFPGPGGQAHVVIRDISFTVEEGQFVSLLGPSGCGKTTLLTMLGGFQAATAGQMLLDGRPIGGPSVERGYVFQNYALFPWMTVKANILYSLKLAGASKTEKDERLERLLELAHLKGHEDKYPVQLSGGMQQRVAVVRALASEPRVLLLDEPLGAVDFQMREIMQNELDQLVRNASATVVMVTHDVSESVFLSDRVLVMSSNAGRLMDDVNINLDRPRDRSSAPFKKLVGDLTDLVRSAFNEKAAAEEL